MENQIDAKEKTGALSALGAVKGPLLIFVASIYFYHIAGKMDEFPGQLGPAFWPKAILLLLMVGCGIKTLEILLARRKGETTEREASLPAVNVPRLLGLIGIVLGAVALMNEIGFLLTNLLFLLSFMYLAGVRKKTTLILSSVIGNVILLYLFVKVVYLPLPKGYWFFDDLTIAIYRLLHLF
jgi:hypothetical protein